MTLSTTELLERWEEATPGDVRRVGDALAQRVRELEAPYHAALAVAIKLQIRLSALEEALRGFGAVGLLIAPDNPKRDTPEIRAIFDAASGLASADAWATAASLLKGEEA